VVAIFEKLPRILISLDLEEQFPLTLVTSLEKGCLIVLPFFLKAGDMVIQDSPFRFKNAWLMNNVFVTLWLGLELNHNKLVRMYVTPSRENQERF
jgi:hypothetical protein